MIGWMQENRKYLVITIWISTIAFVGAGFVGWGSYQYGGAGSSVAKVEDRKIEFSTYQLAYQNLYNQYNAILGGGMDEATAREMGLPDIALHNLINQAHFLNLADSYGIIVSDEEVAHQITQIQAFHVDGVFDPQVYRQSLLQMRLKPSDFEQILADEIKLNKLLSLLSIGANDLEKKVLSSVVADKIEYKVLTLKNIETTISDDEVREFYERYKYEFMSDKEYLVEVHWTYSDGIEYAHDEIDAYYEEARFNHRDSEGKILPLEEVYELMVQEFQMQRARAQAQREYISLRNGEISELESMQVKLYEYFSNETWADLEGAKVGEIIKPTAVDNRYATIKVVQIVEPQVKPFEDVKLLVKEQAIYEKSLQKLQEYANTQLESFSGTQTEFFTMSNVPDFDGLNEYEGFEFARELFLSQNASGVFHRGEVAVIYRILEQKLVEESMGRSGDKEAVFEDNLLKRLQNEQKTRVYIN